MKIDWIQRIRLVYVFSTACAFASAAESVDINLNVSHSVGGVSTFDRETYMVIHAGLTDNDWDSSAQRADMLNGYDTYLGRSNGTLPWNLTQTTEDPLKPGWCNHAQMTTRGNSAIATYASNTAVHALEFRAHKMMIGGQMNMYPNGQTNAKNFAVTDPEALGDYFGTFLSSFYGTGGTGGEPKPAMVEVLNEPFVKAAEYGTTREAISALHNTVAQHIRASNPNVLVGGYTAAHPQYEGSNFGHWNSNWKTFIDIAGANMDFFSLHLYDNPNGSLDTTQTQFRSGSNVEAILDMLEQYSVLSLGHVVPFNISEYGSLSVFNDAPYSREEDWTNLRSFSSMLMQFLDRPDRMIQTIPFAVLKGEWGRNPVSGNPYPSRWLRQKFEVPGQTGNEWEYTELAKFLELWKEVRGTRVDTTASDPDIQVDAYVNGSTAFVILNSLDASGSQTVDLNVFGGGALVQVDGKHVYADAAGIPVLDQWTSGSLSQVTLGASATMVLKLTYAAPVYQPVRSVESKYYATQYLKPISVGTPVVLTIQNVDRSSPFGEAVLRIGVGRDHGFSLHPTVLVNGTPVPVPTDLRGDNQPNRDRFFGVLEVPVPYALLQETNTVSITFPDTNGHVSSLSMQVFGFSADIRSENVQQQTLVADNFNPRLSGVFGSPSAGTIEFRSGGPNADSLPGTPTASPSKVDFQWTGLDLDGVGGADDTIYFTLAAYGSTDGLASPANVQANNEGWGVLNPVLDAGETMRFEIEDVSLGAGTGGSVVFDGFTAARLIKKTLQGTGTSAVGTVNGVVTPFTPDDARYLTKGADFPPTWSVDLATTVQDGIDLAVRDFDLRFSYEPPFVPVVQNVTDTVDFMTAEGFVNGPLGGQVGWNAMAGWDVDATAGTATTTATGKNMTLASSPVSGSSGQSISGTVVCKLNGALGTLTTNAYQLQLGFSTNNTGASLVNQPDRIQLQLYSTSSALRLYQPGTGKAGIVDGSNITDYSIGDVLSLTYTVNLGADAASTSLAWVLKNVTRSFTAPITETITGIDSGLYAALTGPGAYFILESVTFNANSSGITGIGIDQVKITRPVVSVPAMTYGTWRTSHGLAASNGVTDADPDGDGFFNLMEYGLGGNPVNAADRGYQPQCSVTPGMFHYTYKARNNAADLTYRMELSESLASHAWIDTGYTLTGTHDLGNGFSEVTAEVPVDADRKFIRLRIERP